MTNLKLADEQPALAKNLEPWSAIHDDPDAIVACGERWKQVAAIIGCTLHGYNDGFGASFFTPDGGVIEVGPKFRKAIAALTAHSDGWREGVEAAAKVAEDLPLQLPDAHASIYGHADDIAAAIRNLAQETTT